MSAEAQTTDEPAHVRHARSSPDKNVSDCPDFPCERCGHPTIITTYYDTGLAPDRECANCGHAY